MAAWTSPTTEPPEGNIAAPVNTGATGQAKQGGLIVNTGGGANGLIVQYGNVGIGTTNPHARLEVNGNIIADTPTENNHVATKGYVDAVGTGVLRVYKSDGVTQLGVYLGITGTDCDSIWYSNGAGDVSMVGTCECAGIPAGCVTQRIYYSGAFCSGDTYVEASDSTGCSCLRDWEDNGWILDFEDSRTTFGSYRTYARCWDMAQNVNGVGITPLTERTCGETGECKVK